MRYAIIENEFFALANLKGLVSKICPDAELVFTSESVQESVRYFSGMPDVDLVFMDIELVDGNCFEILRQTSVEAPVVFTTAYDNYALEAFRLDTVDYLLKPITESAVLHSIEKYKHRGIRRIKEENLSELLKSFDNSRTFPIRILTAQGDGYSFEDVSQIAFFFAEEKYTFFSDFAGKTSMTLYSSLSKIEEDMDPSQFFRISRSILVNIKAVKSVKKHFNGRLKVEIEAGEKSCFETLASSRRASFLRWLGASGVV